jgi:spermidine synthase
VTRPWITLETVNSDAGPIELRRRDTGDYLITVAGRVLMNSRAHRSETALAELACRHIRGVRYPAVLIGGLGMGYTLRATLDALPVHARVVVAEVNPTVADWCRGPLAELTGNAVGDPRVVMRVEDVMSTVALAGSKGNTQFDAILFDLYEGPSTNTSRRNDPFYDEHAVGQIRRALNPGGVLAVWSEQPCAAYERRLRAAGYAVELSRPGRGGLRHAVYVARTPRS